MADDRRRFGRGNLPRAQAGEGLGLGLRDLIGSLMDRGRLAEGEKVRDQLLFEIEQEQQQEQLEEVFAARKERLAGLELAGAVGMDLGEGKFGGGEQIDAAFSDFNKAEFEQRFPIDQAGLEASDIQRDRDPALDVQELETPRTPTAPTERAPEGLMDKTKQFFGIPVQADTDLDQSPLLSAGAEAKMELERIFRGREDDPNMASLLRDIGTIKADQAINSQIGQLSEMTGVSKNHLRSLGFDGLELFKQAAKDGDLRKLQVVDIRGITPDGNAGFKKAIVDLANPSRKPVFIRGDDAPFLENAIQRVGEEEKLKPRERRKILQKGVAVKKMVLQAHKVYNSITPDLFLGSVDTVVGKLFGLVEQVAKVARATTDDGMSELKFSEIQQFAPQKLQDQMKGNARLRTLYTNLVATYARMMNPGNTRLTAQNFKIAATIAGLDYGNAPRMRASVLAMANQAVDDFTIDSTQWDLTPEGGASGGFGTSLRESDAPANKMLSMPPLSRIWLKSNEQENLGSVSPEEHEQAMSMWGINFDIPIYHEGTGKKVTGREMFEIAKTTGFTGAVIGKVSKFTDEMLRQMKMTRIPEVAGPPQPVTQIEIDADMTDEDINILLGEGARAGIIPFADRSE